MNLLNFYTQQFTEQIFPFWQKAFDEEFGGVYTCFNNEGTELISDDKYVWSQGRYLWVLGKIYELIKKQELEIDSMLIEKQATKTLVFLKENVLLKEGSCCFLLTREGTKKEVIPGKGYDHSIFADCFVLLGFAKYVKEFSRSEELAKWIWTLFQNVEKRILSNSYRTEPYPTPKDMKAHSIPMIMLNVVQELRECYEEMKDEKKVEYLLIDEKNYMDKISHEFIDSSYRVGELLYLNSARDDKTILGRHLNPGHTIEDAWFIAHTALRMQDEKMLSVAKGIALKALELGWDKKSSGLLRYVDYEAGGKPQGALLSDDFSQLIDETWDYKLWWPHAESLYTTLLFSSIYQDEGFEEWYMKLHHYIFKTFPSDNLEVGEWIQIRKRNGVPENRVVALPVKDPYHIMRSMLLIIDLLSNQPQFLNEIDNKF